MFVMVWLMIYNRP